MNSRFPEEYIRSLRTLKGRDLEASAHQHLVDIQKKIQFKVYAERKRGYHIVKRAFDLMLTSFLLILLSPIFVGMFMGCRFFIRGPVLFKQLRLGQGGELFWIYKFRSLHIHHSKLGEDQSPFAKVKSNTATNAFGHFIRNFKLDELAQLLNVLRGEMSLVGPRPFSVDDSAIVPSFYDIRLYPKPGMTGLWQSRFSSETSPRSKILLDCMYARKANFWLDIDCLWRTVRIVLLGEKLAPKYSPFREKPFVFSKHEQNEQIKKAS
jgi:lipopolysaccharide/colanic/teichoic acid biosynthesis glycosyltransferase